MPTASGPAVSRFFHLVSAHETDLDMAQAEARALVGDEWLSPRVAVAPHRAVVSHSAFLTVCGQLIWAGTDFEELLAELRAHPICAPGFRIDAEKYPRGKGPARQLLCKRIGDTFEGAPCLDAPRHRFFLVLDEGHYTFGRVLERNATDWNPRVYKPFSFTASLGPMLARVAVNLVARPGQSIVDPCCGSGTIVTEAASIGVEAAGFDILRDMPARARGNARALGLSALFGVADVRTLAGEFDAVVTNLPYDVMTQIPDDFYREALGNLARLAPRAAFFAARDLSGVAGEAGLSMEQLIPCRKHSIRRYLHIACTGV